MQFSGTALLLICPISIVLLAHGQHLIEIAGNGTREMSTTALTGEASLAQLISMRIRKNSTAAASGKPSDGNDEEPPKRIVGGIQIPITTAPWQAAFIVDGNFACGASVISPLWVLLAAHCFQDGDLRRNVFIRAGTDNFRTGGQTRRIIFIARHGAYNPTTSDFDVAMVRVRRRFTFSNTLRSILLPNPLMAIPNVFFVSGWGSLNENTGALVGRLRGVNVLRVDQNTCRNQYTQNGPITANMICARAQGRDACDGDSGGAMTRNGIQWGIVSFGVGCARPNFPGVYTNVQRMVPWIIAVAQRYPNFGNNRQAYHTRNKVRIVYLG